MISFYSNLKKRFLRQIVSLYQQTNFEQYHGIYHVHTYMGILVNVDLNAFCTHVNSILIVWKLCFYHSLCQCLTQCLNQILSPNVNVMTIIFIFMSDCVLLLFVGIWLSNISSQLVFFFAFLFESGYF